MDIEKKMVVAAPVNRVWDLLLDPKIMAGCIPGIQSVEVLSDTEYLAEIKIKISFISARFKIKTKILETRPPHYLLCEGTGEDASVASSVKQTSEMFLIEQPDGGTEVLIKVKADVFGRLGSFGLSVMKTKADRMWDEFAANVAAVLRQDQERPAIAPVSKAPDSTGTDPRAAKAVAASPAHATARTSAARPAKAKWWQRIVAPTGRDSDTISELRLPTDIYIELHRDNSVIKVLWPANAPADITLWLKDILR